MLNPYGWYPIVVNLIRNAIAEFNWVGNPQVLMYQGDDFTKNLPACLVVPRKPKVDATLSKLSVDRKQRIKIVVIVGATPKDQTAVATGAEITAGALLVKVAETLMGAELEGFPGRKIEMIDDDDDPVYTDKGYAQFSLLFQFQFVLTR